MKTNTITKSNSEAWAKAQVRNMAKKTEELLGISGFANELILVVDNRGRRCYGGLKKQKPYVKIANKGIHYRILYNMSLFREYGSIADHPVIGNYNDGTIDGAVLCVIIHEIAHAVDYWTMRVKTEYKDIVNKKVSAHYFPSDGRTSVNGGHGKRWKQIYAYLRQILLHHGKEVVPVHYGPSTMSATIEKRKYDKTILVRTTKKLNTHGVDRKIYTYADKIGYSVVAERDWDNGPWYVALFKGSDLVKHIPVVDYYGELERDGRKIRGVAKKALEEAYGG